MQPVSSAVPAWRRADGPTARPEGPARPNFGGVASCRSALRGAASCRCDDPMTTTRVGAMPVTTFAADTVVRVAADADLWEIAATLDDAEVGAVVVGSIDDVCG